MGGIFWVDLTIQLGVVIWVFYLAPLMFSVFLSRSRTPLLVAAGCTTLIVLGMTLSPLPTQGSVEIYQLNRTFGIATIWGVAIMGRQFISGRLSLQMRDWLKEGQSRLGVQMNGEQKQAELGDNVLGFLCGYLTAPVGVFYIADRDGAFRRAASYALPEEWGRPSIAPGEGLIGQAIRSKRPLRFDDVPETYLPVSSALGRSRARHLVIMPAMADGKVNGVLELGFFRPLERADMELLEQVAEPVGVAIRSLQYRALLEDLLEETQRQAATLQSQQDELRASNDQLEEQSRALLESQAQLEEQQAELEQTNAYLEEQTHTLEEQRDELSRIQAELEERAQELARANQYKSEFLANMSHELRTPLNSALILSKLLADNKGGNLSAEQVKYAGMIHAAGNDLLALISDILDLSRIEAGRMDMQPEEVELGRMVESVARTVRPIAQDKRLAFHCTIEPGTPSPITTDPLRLQQILRNLLSNAVKFTERGEVSLHVRGVGGDRVEFAVRDTGVGIAREHQESIFEAFRQADGSTHRKYGGTGLGLAISRELARRLGGDLRVTSAREQGSTFTLALPVTFGAGAIEPAREPEAERSAPGAAARPGAPAPELIASMVEDDRDSLAPGDRTILVIEDDSRFARILYDLAHELGFRCIMTPSGDEGLVLARRHQPSAIVLDMHLPDHSGLAVLEQLKRTAATRHIPVHVISVSDYTQQAREMGAIGYALKPVKREELVRALQSLEDRLEQTIRRVLVVEDVDMQRESIVHLLGADNVEIVAVSTGSDALRELGQTSFDCMVLDLVLPDMSGYDLLDRMAADEAFSFPPVIVYTGGTLTREDEYKLRRYASSIVIKGVRSPERLVDEVTLFLHQVEAQLPPEQQRMLRAVRERDAILEGRRILIVEDDVRNVFALASVLEPQGARIEIARNGKEALEALERAAHAPGGGVDLVLMDIMMPEMDGLTATREIRKRPPWQKLPIIALTAKAMPDDRAKCIEAGASDYITKPLDVDKLLSLVKVWMPK